MAKVFKIEAGKAQRGSVRFNIAKDGSLEQVINLYKQNEETVSTVLLKTKNGKLAASKHGLGISVFFDREKMNYDEIVERFYAETDEMAEYIAHHQPEIKEAIRQAFGNKEQTITILKGGDAA